MKILLWSVLTYSVFVMQTSLVPALDWGCLAPQLVLAALVAVVGRSTGNVALLTAAVWGLISDGLSTTPLGIHLTLFVLGAWTIQLVRGRRFSGAAVPSGLLTGAFVFLVMSCSAVARSVLADDPVDVQRITAWAGGAACSTALMTSAAILLWRLLQPSMMSESPARTPRPANHWNTVAD